MFYVQEVLSKKGPLGKVWLAAHMERKLTRSQIIQTNIQSSAELVKQPKEELALRLSGHLLLGLSRIFSKKVHYLLNDCSDALVKIKRAFRPDTSVDMNEHESTARLDSITLAHTSEDATLMNNDLLMPLVHEVDDIGLNLDITVNAQDVMLEGDYPAIDDELLGDTNSVLLPVIDNDDVMTDALSSHPDELSSQGPATPLQDLEVLRREEQSADGPAAPVDASFVAEDAQDGFDDTFEQDPPPIDDAMLDEIPEIPDGSPDLLDYPSTPLGNTVTSPMQTQDASLLSLDRGSAVQSPSIRVRRENRKLRAIDVGATELSGDAMKKQIASCNDLLAARRQAPLFFNECVAESVCELFGDEEWIFATGVGPSRGEGLGLGLKDFMVEHMRSGFVQTAEQAKARVTSNSRGEDTPVERLRGDTHVSPLAREDAALQGIDANNSMLDVPLESRDHLPDVAMDPLIDADLVPLGDVDALQDGMPSENLSAGGGGFESPLSSRESSQASRNASSRAQQQSSWSGRTRKMLNFLELTMAGKDSLTFAEICEGKKKRVVAGAFFETLVLKSRGIIQVNQPEPFGEIEISKTDKFSTLTDTPSSAGSILSNSSTPLSFFSSSNTSRTPSSTSSPAKRRRRNRAVPAPAIPVS